MTRAGADQFRDRHAGAETELEDFNAGITARLAGQPLSQSHRQLHRPTTR